MKAEVVALALDHGAAIANDVWGLQRDSAMAPLVAARGVPVIVMHNRDSVDPAIDIIADMKAFFLRSLDIAAKAGIARDKIVLDPGIGFGKTAEQSMIALARLREFDMFGLPILVGASRKRFIASVSPSEPTERLAGSIAAHLIAAQRGAKIIRTHDVAETLQALRVAHAIEEQAMTDTIFVTGLSIHARHGVMEHETEVGQRFVIDLELYTDLSEPSRTDRLADTVSYADVVATTTAAFKNTNYKLLERAAGAVADAILSHFPRIRAVKITVHKPHAPIAAIFDDVGIMLTRSRHPAHGERPDCARRQCRRCPRDVPEGDRPYLRHGAGRADRALLRLCDPALGRRGPGSLHQRLRRDRDRPRSACAAVHAAQGRAEIRPRPRQGAALGPAHARSRPDRL